MGNDEDQEEDRDEDGGGAEVGLALGHEKLRVYQRGLDYASWTHSMLGNIEQSAAVLRALTSERFIRVVLRKKRTS